MRLRHLFGRVLIGEHNPLLIWFAVHFSVYLAKIPLSPVQDTVVPANKDMLRGLSMPLHYQFHYCHNFHTNTSEYDHAV